MPKISVAQFFVMLFLCRIFTFFTEIPGMIQSSGSSGSLLGILLSGILFLLAMLPGFLLLRRRQGMGIIEAAYQKNTDLGVAFAAYFGLVSLIEAADNSLRFALFMNTAVYPEEHIWLFILLFIAAAIYVVWLGLEAAARFSGGVLALLILSMLLIAVSLAPRFDTTALASPFLNGGKDVLEGASMTLNETGELVLVLLFIPYLRGNVKKGYLWWTLSLIVTLTLISFLVLTTVGGYAVTQAFPLYAAARSARLFNLQRMDAVHMVIWTMMGFVKTVLFLFIGHRCFCYILSRRTQRHLLLVLSGMVAIASLLLSQYFQVYEALYRLFLSGIPLLVSIVILPLLLILLRSPKKEGQR